MNKRYQINIFFKQWLLHAFLYWAITVGYTCFNYYLKLLKHGHYLWHKDGSPTTVWDYFYEMNRYQYAWLWALIFTYLVELMRSKFYSEKRFPLFVIAALTGGIFWSSIRAIYAVLKFKEALQLTNILKIETIANFVVYAMVYAVAREFIVQKLYLKEVRLVKSESELSALKAQVNPHFLFNTFNYVYGTALQENALNTAKAIEMMTEMMRYTMSVMQDKLVPLSDELRFIKNYVDLQMLRLPDRSNIKIEIEFPSEEQTNGMIAPMLMIPLIENAFKYAISIDQDCFIKLQISVANNQLILKIENSIPKNKITNSNLGTGINNVTQRLKLLYPRKHLFDIKKYADKYVVEVHIPVE